MLIYIYQPAIYADLSKESAPKGAAQLSVVVPERDLGSRTVNRDGQKAIFGRGANRVVRESADRAARTVGKRHRVRNRRIGNIKGSRLRALEFLNVRSSHFLY